MLTHWKHLSLDDRKMIGNMIGHDAKAKTIAIILKMDPTAISKEVKRNRTQLSKLTKDFKGCTTMQKDKPYLYSLKVKSKKDVNKNRSFILNVFLLKAV
jgi:IS30 family transposase